MLQTVPVNFTHLFQPFDVQGDTNGYAKRFMKGKFMEWYTEQITQAMDAGQELDSIDIKLQLSIITPLNAKWIIELYNEMTSGDSREICLKGWIVSDIKKEVDMELSDLPQLDPFEAIDPMFEGDADMKSIGPSSILEVSK